LARKNAQSDQTIQVADLTDTLFNLPIHHIGISLLNAEPAMGRKCSPARSEQHRA
jgi:hypothetical protein